MFSKTSKEIPVPVFPFLGMRIIKLHKKYNQLICFKPEKLLFSRLFVLLCFVVVGFFLAVFCFGTQHSWVFHKYYYFGF